MKKAYIVRDKDGEYSDIVFAESPSLARSAALFCDGFEDSRYTDIRVKRIPDLDKFAEKEMPRYGAWYDNDIRTILVRDHGWYCVYPREEECEACKVKKYCEFWEAD